MPESQSFELSETGLGILFIQFGSDAEYDYVFAGWEPEVSEYVKTDAVYTAKYNKVKKSYKVTFVDEDSTVLKAATAYEYGTKAADIVQPATPSKQETETCTYEFAGWSPELQDVTADATYTAVYKEIVKETTPKQTGDLGYSELFFILMLLSIAGFITVISMKKKERN